MWGRSFSFSQMDSISSSSGRNFQPARVTIHGLVYAVRLSKVTSRLMCPKLRRRKRSVRCVASVWGVPVHIQQSFIVKADVIDDRGVALSFADRVTQIGRLDDLGERPAIQENLPVVIV